MTTTRVPVRIIRPGDAVMLDGLSWVVEKVSTSALTGRPIMLLARFTGYGIDFHITRCALTVWEADAITD